MANVTAETFVVLEPFTEQKSIIIGRNSLVGVCTEILYYPAAADEGSRQVSKRWLKIALIQLTEQVKYHFFS